MAESFHHLSWLIPIISVSSPRVHKHVCRLNHGPEHLIKTLPCLGSEKRLCSPMTRLEEKRDWDLDCFIQRRVSKPKAHQGTPAWAFSWVSHFCRQFHRYGSFRSFIEQFGLAALLLEFCLLSRVLILWMILDMVTLLLVGLCQNMLMYPLL